MTRFHVRMFALSHFPTFPLMATLLFCGGCGGVRWRPDLGGAMRLAAQRNQVVVVQVHSMMDADCRRMERDVFSRKDVRETMQGVIAVRLDASLNRRFREDYALNLIPSFVAFGPDGQVLRSAQGYMDEGRFRGFVEAARLSY